MASSRPDESNRRQPTPQDPWPGGRTTARWPCWCTKCKGAHKRSRHIRDKHRWINGVFTTEGVSNVQESRNVEPAVENQVEKTQDAEGINPPTSDYIVLENGDIISPLSAPGGGNPDTADHMRSLLKGYNPRRYGYLEPLPINKKFKCWERLWEIKQSTLGVKAGLGLFAGEDIIVRETRGGFVSNVHLFPYCGPTYQCKDWEMIVLEWPQMKTYSLLANKSTRSHYTRGVYIDGTPSYTWCIAAYINSGIYQPSTVNVQWEESYISDSVLHLETKIPCVWCVASRTIHAGEELFTHYPIVRV